MAKKRKDGYYVTTKTIDGVRRSFYGITRREAEQKRDAYVESLHASRHFDPTITLNQWIDHWLAMKADDVSASTLENYTALINRYIRPNALLPLAEYTTPGIRNIINEIRMTNSLSDRTLFYILHLYRTIFQQAVNDEIIPRNPTIGIKIKRTRAKKEKVTLTAAQVDEFLRHSGKYYALFRLAFATGMRRSELLGLRWQDVDIKHSTVTVNQTVLRRKGTAILSPTTKNASSQRTIPIDQHTMQALEQHRVTVYKDRMQDCRYINHDLVFPGRHGQPISPDYVSKLCHKIATKIGQPNFSMHGTRHTHATLLIEQNINLKTVQLRLGHSTFEQTMNTYSHVTAAMEESAAGTVSKLFSC